MGRYQLTSIVGLSFMVFLAYLCSRDRSNIRWKPVLWGMVMQAVMGVLVLKSAAGRVFFLWVNDVIVALLNFQLEGAQMVFSFLSIPPGQPGSLGFVFAFQVLTTVIFFSALISVLYYLGVMQLVMVAFARVMKKFMGTSGAETLSASANVFVGQTEAPLLIKPYIKEMTNSELLCMMVGGMATVSGGVMGAYVGLLREYFPNIAGHLLAASLMSAPAGMAVSKILVPETNDPVTMGTVKLMHHGDKSTNVLEAVTNGAQTGLQLALNVGTMLISFMGLIALVNALLSWGGSWVGFESVTIQSLLGYLCAPLAFLMGTPWADCLTVGQLIGEKTGINEFVAYLHFAEILREGKIQLSERSMVICTYALTGFSNLLSIGIQVGGIGAIVPERKSDLARLGLLALLGGSLACFMTACVAGILL